MIVYNRFRLAVWSKIQEKFMKRKTIFWISWKIRKIRSIWKSWRLFTARGKKKKVRVIMESKMMLALFNLKGVLRRRKKRIISLKNRERPESLSSSTQGNILKLLSSCFSKRFLNPLKNLVISNNYTRTSLQDCYPSFHLLWLWNLWLLRKDSHYLSSPWSYWVWWGRQSSNVSLKKYKNKIGLLFFGVSASTWVWVVERSFSSESKILLKKYSFSWSSMFLNFGERKITKNQSKFRH